MTETVIVESNELSELVGKLASDISGGGGNLADTAIVGIHKRGVPLAARLVDIIKSEHGAELETGSLDITLYRDDLSDVSAQPEVQATEIEFDVNGKRIVLVDDVLYTGRTARAAISEILDFGRPRRIELAVLIDRGHQELPIKADHVGKSVETTPEQMVEVKLSETDGEDKVLLMEKGE